MAPIAPYQTATGDEGLATVATPSDELAAGGQATLAVSWADPGGRAQYTTLRTQGHVHGHGSCGRPSGSYSGIRVTADQCHVHTQEVTITVG